MDTKLMLILKMQTSMYVSLVPQLCLTLCESTDCSWPGSFVHRDSPGKNIGVGLICPPPEDLINPGIKPRFPALHADSSIVWATNKAHEYWSGLLSPSPGYFPGSGIELGYPALQVDSLPAELLGKSAYF